MNKYEAAVVELADALCLMGRAIARQFTRS